MSKFKDYFNNEYKEIQKHDDAKLNYIACQILTIEQTKTEIIRGHNKTMRGLNDWQNNWFINCIWWCSIISC